MPANNKTQMSGTVSAGDLLQSVSEMHFVIIGSPGDRQRSRAAGFQQREELRAQDVAPSVERQLTALELQGQFDERADRGLVTAIDRVR